MQSLNYNSSKAKMLRHMPSYKCTSSMRSAFHTWQTSCDFSIDNLRTCQLLNEALKHCTDCRPLAVAVKCRVTCYVLNLTGHVCRGWSLGLGQCYSSAATQRHAICVSFRNYFTKITDRRVGIRTATGQVSNQVLHESLLHSILVSIHQGTT